jgi:hypothetical protein
MATHHTHSVLKPNIQLKKLPDFFQRIEFPPLRKNGCCNKDAPCGASLLLGIARRFAPRDP